MSKRALSIFALTLFLVVACLKGFAAGPGGMPMAVHVDVYKVPKPSTMNVDLEYPARLKSIKQVTIVARVAGTLLQKYYTEGQFVKKGQLLYLIEPDIYKARLDSAKAQLESALASFKKAKRDWLRIKPLYESKAISQQERDRYLSAYEVAKANLNLAKANLKAAQIDYNYTKVKATISGFTSLKHVDVGSYVTPRQALVTITAIDPIYAEFSIPDTDIEKIKTGQIKMPKDISAIKAYLKIDKRMYKLAGSVNFLDKIVNPETSSVKARAVFENPNSYLMPNEFVRIVLKGFKRENVTLVPQEAVLQNPLGTIVFVVDKGRVGIRPVKINGTSGKYFVVEAGLRGGELVIVDNFFKIKPGMPVKIDKVVNKGGF